MVYSVVAHETATGSKEQVRVGTSQMRQRVKSHTIDGHKDRGREMRLGEELYPVSVMVIRHVLQNYSSTIQSPPFIQPALTKNYHYLNVRTIKETDGVKRMDVGLRKTIGADVGRPGSGSNQTRGILSLHNPFSTKAGTNRASGLTSWDDSGSCAMPTK
jgi:hypothetical protein